MALPIKLSPRLVMLLSFAGTSVANYIFGIAIGWLLVPGDLGLIGFAQTVILICSLILNSGLAWSLTTQIAEASDSQRPGLVRGFMFVNLGLAALLMVGVIGLFAGDILRTGLESWTVVWVIVLSLPFLSIVAIAYGAVRGAEAFGSLATIKVLEVVVKVVAGIAFVLMGYGALGALSGFLIGSIVAAGFGIWRVQVSLKMALFGELIYPSLRLAGSMFGALLGMAILLNLDILFVKSLAANGREAAGFYQAAILLANTPYYMTTALLSVLFPQLARQSDIRLSLQPVLSTLRIVLLFFIPFELVLFIAADHVLGLIFPEVYLEATALLRILALGNVTLILTALLSTVFEATKQARIPAMVLIASVIAEFFALWLVVPRYGAEGAAVVFGLTCSAAFIIQFIMYLRRIPRPVWHTGNIWVATYIGSLVVAVVVYFSMMSLSQHFVMSALVAGLAYLATTALTGILPLTRPQLWLKRG